MAGAGRRWSDEEVTALGQHPGWRSPTWRVRGKADDGSRREQGQASGFSK